MPETQQSQVPILTISGVLAFVALLTTWLFSTTPLHTNRPTAATAAHPSAFSVQDVEARLWQDPFDAAGEHHRNSLTNSEERLALHSIDQLSNDVRISIEQKKNSIVLAVMETGSPYAENHESRLKSRYAVVSSLDVAGYVPKDPEHIGYLEFSTWPSVHKGVSFGGVTAPLIVPFEWFLKSPFQNSTQSGCAKHDEILVLWLQAEAFNETPLQRIGLLMGCFGTNIWNSSNTAFKIVGPRNSTTLKAMIQDNSGLAPSVELYSSWATAADALIATNATSVRRENVREQLRGRGIIFFPVVCNDDELAGELVNELDLRGVSFTSGRNTDRIALVAEWDTFYGQAVPLAFAAKIEQTKDAMLGRSSSLTDYLIYAGDTIIPNPWLTNNVRQFAYLRGMDGELPTEKADKPVQGTVSDRSKQSQGLQTPEGTSQLDYMPRLVNELKSWDDELKASQRGRLKAIGVLGSDVYDKLLVIQALRESFHDLLFFTTDLDARLLEPNTMKATANLIVASSFGLKLADSYQGTIPPFRDSYQTSQFLACLEAAGFASTTLIPSPRCYEIGRDGFHDLSRTTPDPYPFPPAFAKAIYYPEIIRQMMFGLTALLLVIGLLCTFNKSLRTLCSYFGTLVIAFLRKAPKLPFPFESIPKWLAALVLAFLIVLPAAVVVAIVVNHYNPEGEPFSITAGISLWPTEIIRLVVFYLGLFLFVQARDDLRKNKDNFHSNFCLPEKISRWDMVRKTYRTVAEPQAAQDARAAHRILPGFLRELLFLRKNVSISLWTGGDFLRNDEINAEKLWEDYNIRGSLVSRLIRIVPLVTAYVTAACCIFLMFDFPLRPYRGPSSNHWDCFLLLLSVVMIIFFIFYVVDATRLCIQLITNLTDYPTCWPDATFSKYEKQIGIPREYLDELIDIEVIGKRTKVVGKLIFYPFLLLFLMIFSRSIFFDRWTWPIPLILVFAANSAYAIYCVFVLRSAAERARRTSIDSLKRKLLQEVGASMRGRTRQSGITQQIRIIIARIEAYDEGAFAPLAKHPVVGALLMPLGGAGLTSLLEYLAAR